MVNQFKNVRDYLTKYFGFKTFRPGQQRVIESILQGEDTVVIFPTGGGKSLCYQLAALMLPGTTIVISPLISLMKDQVDQLAQREISCTFISSILSEQEIAYRIHGMSKGNYKIVYIAPERFYSQDFLDALKTIHVSFVAIDEAHCISQWGHNFRPAYLKVKDLIDRVGNPVVAAFTATANRRVQNDIIKLLDMGRCKLFVSSFDRPNLEFGVERPIDKRVFVLKYAKQNINKSGIIYAGTRKNVEELYGLMLNNGISAGMYHAGLSSQDRNRAQEDFIQDKVSVMVATNAFGMGIDKSDVRYIIHYNMPKSLEYYYQEAGRAGRDGGLASCILLYSESDYRLNRFLIGVNYPSIKLVKGAYNRVLRAGKQGINIERLVRSRVISKQSMHSAVRKLIQYNYIDVKGGMVFPFSMGRELELTQEEIDRHKDIEINKLESIIGYCNSTGCLRRYILEYFNETPGFTKCGNCSVCGLDSDGTKKESMNQLLASILDTDSGMSNRHVKDDMDWALLENLKIVRERLALKIGETSYTVFDDKTLEEIAAKKPVTRKQMLKIGRVGRLKPQNFADEFLQEIHRYLRQKTV
jgi:ATP-dependent DNA helicase RecQ